MFVFGEIKCFFNCSEGRFGTKRASHHVEKPTLQVMKGFITKLNIHRETIWYMLQPLSYMVSFGEIHVFLQFS
jgi:hypothetical protein